MTDSIAILWPTTPASVDTFSVIEPRLEADTAADYSFRMEVATPAQAILRNEELPPAWLCGLEPRPLGTAPGSQNGVILVIAVLLVMVLFNFNSLRQMLRFNVDELFTIRKGRDNVFDERPASMSVVQVLLIALFLVCSGFLLACGASSHFYCSGAFDFSRSILPGIAISLGYYLVELTGCNAVGYTFASPEGRREWVRGLNASFSLLGIALTVPALLAVFYPTLSASMVVLAIILFILGRIFFVFKGFRIFFDNLFSLLYFILYLCTLEIVPIILVYKITEILVG